MAFYTYDAFNGAVNGSSWQKLSDTRFEYSHYLLSFSKIRQALRKVFKWSNCRPKVTGIFPVWLNCVQDRFHPYHGATSSQYHSINYNTYYLLFPLSFSTHNIIINQNLSSICEISKLGFPNDQRIGVGNIIAILKAQNTILTQMAISNCKPLFLFFVQSIVNWPDFLLHLLVMHNRMSMRKCSSFHILSGKTHSVTFVQQRVESQRFSSSKVNSSLRYWFVSLFVYFLDLRVSVYSCYFWYLMSEFS